MEIKIKDGVTIISTGVPAAQIRNKHGHVGIVYRENQRRKYIAEITIKKHKHRIGCFDTVEQAVKAREIANQKKKDGILLEWLKQLPSAHTGIYDEYWERELNEH